jgi:S-adenosylmethionine synthetase
MARYIAKNVVAAGLADAARSSSPTRSAWPSRSACLVDTFGTGKLSQRAAAALLMRETFPI